MDWFDNIINSPTMQSLIGGANSMLGGGQSPAPNPMTPGEPNPVTGGMMPLPAPAGANNVPGMGTAPGGIAGGVAPNIDTPPMGFQASVTGAPLGGTGSPTPAGTGVVMPGMTDPTTGNKINTDPLASSTANPLPSGGGGPVPMPQPRPPDPGSPGVPMPPVGLGPQSQPQPGPGAPGGPPGGAGIVGGGPGSTQVPMPPPRMIPTSTGPTPVTPPPPGTSPVGAGGAGGPGGPGSFMSNVFGTPQQPSNLSNFLRTFGHGLSNAANNWNKPGMVAFSAGLGGSLEAGGALQEKQQQQKFNNSQTAFGNVLKAMQTDNMAKRQSAMADYYKARGDEANARAKAINEGRPFSATGKGASPFYAATQANNTAERFRDNQRKQLDMKVRAARDQGKPMSPTDIENETQRINQATDKYRNDLYQRAGLNPQQGQSELNRGIAQPWKQGDAAEEGRIYLNKDGTMTPKPTPNTTSSVLPFKPTNMDEMKQVLPGQYFVNPATGRLKRRNPADSSPEVGGGEQKTSQADQDRQDQADEWEGNQADQEVAEAA